MKSNLVDKSSKINDRISEIRAKLCSDSNTIFAAKINKSTQFSSALCRGTSNPGKKMLEEILVAFPEVSRTWLYFGEGEMLKSNESVNDQTNVNIGGDNIVNGSSKSTSEGLEAIMELVLSQQKTIQELTEQNKILTQIIANKIQ